jgi:hypothetical protein
VVVTRCVLRSLVPSVLLCDASAIKLIEPQPNRTLDLRRIIPVLAVEQAPADELINVGLGDLYLKDLEAAFAPRTPTRGPKCAGMPPGYTRVRYDLDIVIYLF